MIICIVGRTASGKDSIAKNIGIENIVSYTDRVRRVGEVDGREHF